MVLAKKGQEVAYSLFENGKISQMEMENAELFFLESELVLLQSKLQYQISLANSDVSFIDTTFYNIQIINDT